jgi:hypothetical protein
LSPDAAAKHLSLLRVLVGAAAWLMPNLTGKALMLDMDGNPQAPYLGRLFGVRDAALGAVTFAAQGEARRKLLVAGVAVDSADAAAAVLGTRAGYLSRLAGTLLAAIALGGLAMGAMALRGGAEAEASPL